MNSNQSRFDRRTRIICTIGPATASPSMIEALIEAGMNLARLNLSHGTYEDHARYIEIIRAAAGRLGVRVGILIDLPGAKYRTGRMKGGSALLEQDAEVILTARPVEGDEKIIPVSSPSFPRAVKVGDRVLIADGEIQLSVQGISDGDVRAKVVAGGTVTPGRGVAVPGMAASATYLTGQMEGHIKFAVSQEPDWIALSLVSSAGDIEQTRLALHKKGGDVPIVAKIERGAAIAEFDGILAASDGIMVARGDLGVDIPLPEVPLVQKEIIRKCNQAGKPVITATQMLESMVSSFEPTRAEVTDVANAIFDGTDAVMLSGETAIGKYPVRAVGMMGQIALAAERELPYDSILEQREAWIKPDIADIIGYEACHTARRLGAAAIVAFTGSGSTAQRVSKFRPREPILAITSSRHASALLSLSWGVRCIQTVDPSSVDELFALAVRVAREFGAAKRGELIVITAGIPIGIRGTTNLLKVERIL